MSGSADAERPRGMTTKTRGRSVWFDLVTKDVERAAGFYGELFGWKHQHVDMGGGMTYTLLTLEGEQVAGLMKPRDPSAAAAWNVYFTTTNTDETAALVAKRGGTVVAPPHDIPDVGRFAAFLDPRGTAFSVLAPTHEKAETLDSKVGEFFWTEANVDSPSELVDFYVECFDWRVNLRDFPGYGVYHELWRGKERPAAGMQKRPKELPAQWIDYVKVGDCEASVRRAARLGAMVLMPTTKLASVGAFAVLQDPTGAVFGVMQPA